jgi:hypothetical protein
MRHCSVNSAVMFICFRGKFTSLKKVIRVIEIVPTISRKSDEIAFVLQGLRDAGLFVDVYYGIRSYADLVGD